jgi:hypothetical protein
MVDLTVEMAELRTSLGAGEGGRVVMFVAATTGEGTSTVAREFARFAASTGDRRVWLVDVDVESQGQVAAVAADPERFGELGPASKGSPDGSAFLAVFPPDTDKSGRPVPAGRLVYVRPALGARLWVAGARLDLVGPGQTAVIDPRSDYWNALRRHAGEIVIDAPAADRADTAVVLAPHADLIVLVVAAEAAPPRAALALKQALEAAGGRVAGLVFNRAEAAPAPRLQRVAS